jgi:hypothetical protein
MQAAQLRLFSPSDEAECYHDTGRYGYFATLVKDDKGVMRQDCYSLSFMPTVLSRLDPKRDTWLSQAEFVRPNRRVVNLARIGLLFADLDTYNMPWSAGLDPDRLAWMVMDHCRNEGIPEPSILIFSGRGIQAKWLLDGVLPRAALPRWNACQRHLVDRLAALGADPAAKDASRVLRLVNTVNSKSGEVCRVVHVTNGQDGEPVRHNFEYLAEALLPVSRLELESQRGQRKERAGRLSVVQGAKTGGLNKFSGRKLAWDRLEDLRTLAELRGGVGDSERTVHLFWRLNFLLLSGATNSAMMYHEAVALGRELDPSWSYRSAELMTLYAKAKAHEAGEKVEFGGRQLSPLYTPKNDTLINTFQITRDEQRQLRTLIDQDMAAERHRKRDEARRRAAGAVDRSAYLDAAEAKRGQAQALKAQGLSVRAIAAQMGVSVGAVSGYLRVDGVQGPCVLQAAVGSA